MKPTLALRSFLLGSSLLAASPMAHAVDYYWDTDSTTSGFGASSGGTWGTSAFWSTSSAGTAATANTTILVTDTVHFGTATDGFSTAGAPAHVLFNGAKTVANITYGSASTAAVVINNASTLTLAATSVITQNNAFGTNIAGVVAGAGTSLTKEGTGTQSFSGVANTWTGATIINGGIVQAQQIGNGNVASSIGQSTNIAANLVLNGATLQKFGASTGTTDRLFTLGTNGGGLANVSSSGDLVFNNTGSIAATGATDRTLTLGGSFGSNSLSPILANASGGGVVSLVKNGVNTWSLGAATNSYSGGTTVNAGILTVGTAGALGSTSGQLTVNGGTLNMGATSLTVGNLTGTGGIISGTAVGTRTLTIGQGNGTGGNYQGAIQNGSGGTTALTKTGSGIITLSGTNTYSGATNVSLGTLAISSTGSINSTTGVTIGVASTAGTSEFNFNSSTALTQPVSFAAASTGGTLSGSGTINQTVNITTGNTLSIGNSVGQMNFGDALILAGTDVVEIDGTSGPGVTGGHDFANVTGALTYGGALSLDFGTTFGIGSYTWNLFDFAGADLGTFATIALDDQYSGSLLDLDTNGVWDLTSGSNTWQFTESTGVLGLTVIPEPGAALLGSLGLLALLRRRR